AGGRRRRTLTEDPMWIKKHTNRDPITYSVTSSSNGDLLGEGATLEEAVEAAEKNIEERIGSAMSLAALVARYFEGGLDLGDRWQTERCTRLAAQELYEIVEQLYCDYRDRSDLRGEAKEEPAPEAPVEKSQREIVETI